MGEAKRRYAATQASPIHELFVFKPDDLGEAFRFQDTIASRMEAMAVDIAVDILQDVRRSAPTKAPAICAGIECQHEFVTDLPAALFAMVPRISKQSERHIDIIGGCLCQHCFARKEIWEVIAAKRAVQIGQIHIGQAAPTELLLEEIIANSIAITGEKYPGEARADILTAVRVGELVPTGNHRRNEKTGELASCYRWATPQEIAETIGSTPAEAAKMTEEERLYALEDAHGIPDDQ